MDKILKSTWFWAPIVLISILLTYLYVFKSVIFPTKEEIIRSNAFEYTNEKTSEGLIYISRIHSDDFRKIQNGDYYKAENEVISNLSDSQIILKDIIVKDDNVLFNFEIRHSFNMFEGEIIILERIEDHNPSLIQPKAYAHDQHGSIPVTVNVEEDQIQVKASVYSERFYQADFSLSIDGFYSLKYKRNWF